VTQDKVTDGNAAGDHQQAPHDPEYFLEKAREMLKRAEQAPSEEDRQTFRALAEQWQRLAQVAVRPHI
jgi:predicted lipid-binding transport protein (Tim44 family)